MWKVKIKQGTNEIVLETECYDDVTLLANTVLGFQALETSVEISCTEETELSRLEKKYKELEDQNTKYLIENMKMRDNLSALKEKYSVKSVLEAGANRGES